jgi:hypothetical protein
MATNPLDFNYYGNPLDFDLNTKKSTTPKAAAKPFSLSTPTTSATKTTTPTTTTNKKAGIDVFKIAGNLLPGVKAIFQSIDQKSFTPYKEYLSATNKKLTEKGGYELAIGFVGGPEDKISKLIKKDFTNYFIKETKPANIQKVLKTFDLPVETTDELSTKLAKATTEDEVLKLIDNLSVETKMATKPVTNQKLSELPPEISKSQVATRPLETPSLSKAVSLEPNVTPGVAKVNPLFSTVPKSIPDPVPQQDAVEQLIKALDEAQPIRNAQEKAYTQARAERIAKVQEVRKTTSGEQGFYQELGQLKGELPKVEFESLRGKVTQDNIDSLFNMVRDHPDLDNFEKIGARNGLVKMFAAPGGVVPTESELKLLSRVFPQPVIDSLLTKKPLLSKIGNGIIEALNVPRSIMSSFDMSAPFRQGIFLVGKKEFWKSFNSMFKQFGSEKAFKALQEDIAARPTFPLMKESKLALMDMDQFLTTREEKFMSSWAEKIPVAGRMVRASGRAYTGFLNKVRADVFDDLLKKAELAGNPLSEKGINDLSKFINSATGRGSIKELDKASTILNTLLFSPRLMMSRLNLLNPQYYATLDPFVRKEAIKSLLTFGSIALTVTGLASAGGAKVVTDPRNADFMKIKVGDTRFDVLGGFQQYIRLASQLISGKIISSTSGKTLTLGEGYKPITRLGILARFFQSKENPVASFITEFLQGQDLLGNKFDLSEAVISRFIPLILQDMFETMQADGLGKALGVALPAFFGIGAQTYSDKKNPASKSKKTSGPNPLNF